VGDCEIYEMDSKDYLLEGPDDEEIGGGLDSNMGSINGANGEGRRDSGGRCFASINRSVRRRFCPTDVGAGDRDLRPNHTAQRFTFSEKERMNEYESLDYNVPQSYVYKKYLQEKTVWWYIRKDLSKWLLFCIVGATVGIVSFLLKQTTELIAEGHFKVTGRFSLRLLSAIFPSPTLLNLAPLP
jgi:hypothetical protein